MMKWLLPLLIWACSTSAVAQDLPDFSAPCAPEITEGRRAVSAQGEVSGIWFRHEVAACILRRLSALPLFVARVHLLEERVHIGEERDVLRQEQVALASQEADQAREILEAAVRGQREAEEQLRSWRHSPLLFAIIGGVLVGALEALAIWALNKIP